jgi:hypothetical protein
MSKQSTKSKLMDLITGTKLPERKIIFIDEDDLLDPETYDDNTTVIIFTDFKKKNENAPENNRYQDLI